MSPNNDLKSETPKTLIEALLVPVYQLPQKLRAPVLIALLLSAGVLASPDWARRVAVDLAAHVAEQLRTQGPKAHAESVPQAHTPNRFQNSHNGIGDDGSALTLSSRPDVSPNKGEAAWIGVRSGDTFYPLLEAASLDPPMRVAAPPKVTEGQFVLVVVDEDIGKSFRSRLNDGELYSFGLESFDHFAGTLELSRPFVRQSQ